ncbi:LysR substrate-binding domain-containing protein [Leisingera sp. XS_AS12]|uniref:LysR substrate-binding domain-containing protein n=1 Tax=Leisingera sp. XS_AS12 TaxID=3241294 RepID=UPI003515F9C0
MQDVRIRPVAVHSLSSSALEAAVSGQGVVLAQRSFVIFDLKLGRLVRLAEDTLPMPEPYFVCWGETTLQQHRARDFLNWVIAKGRELSR